jgi:hypothetical protein
MRATGSGWMCCKRLSVTLLWIVGVTTSWAAFPRGAFAMSVQMPTQTQADLGFSIVFDLDFVDDVLRVTLPKSDGGVLDGNDVLTLTHPLRALEQVAVDFAPGRGLRVSFDSAPANLGGNGSSGGSGGNGSSGSVPEPASAALLGMAVLGATWVRRRRLA